MCRHYSSFPASDTHNFCIPPRASIQNPFYSTAQQRSSSQTRNDPKHTPCFQNTPPHPQEASSRRIDCFCIPLQNCTSSLMDSSRTPPHPRISCSRNNFPCTSQHVFSRCRYTFCIPPQARHLNMFLHRNPQDSCNNPQPQSRIFRFHINQFAGNPYLGSKCILKDSTHPRQCTVLLKSDCTEQCMFLDLSSYPLCRSYCRHIVNPHCMQECCKPHCSISFPQCIRNPAGSLSSPLQHHKLHSHSWLSSHCQ